MVSETARKIAHEAGGIIDKLQSLGEEKRKMKNIKKMTPYQMALFSPILTYIIRDLPKERNIPLNVKFVALDRFPDEANNGWEVRGLGVGAEDMEYRSNQISIKWETMKAGYSEETLQKKLMPSWLRNF